MFMMKYIKSTKGFTLIEVIIVLSLITIFSAIAVPSFAQNERRELRQAASIIKHDIRYAQRMSLITAREYQVWIEEQYNRYIVSIPILGGSEIVREVSMPPSVEIYQVTMYSIPRVEFTPRGTTGDAGTIRLRTARYNTYLTVNVGSGRVRIGHITPRTDWGRAS